MSKKSHFELVKYEPHKINFEELIFIFTLASILGFIVETIYVYLVCGNIVKRGVLIGPYCPIYGFGAIILYLSFFEVRREKQNIPLIFIISSLLMGSFELMCGLGFKYFLNIEMWNYAGKFLNILNYTTVPILISWGILGTIYVFFVHPLHYSMCIHWQPSSFLWRKNLCHQQRTIVWMSIRMSHQRSPCLVCSMEPYESMIIHIKNYIPAKQ